MKLFCCFTRLDFVKASNLHSGVYYTFDKHVIFITKQNIGTVSTLAKQRI